MTDQQSIWIKADDENNADEFWWHFNYDFPQTADALRHGNAIEISVQFWSKLRQLPGFSDGPAYARDALIPTEPKPTWNSVTA